MLAKLIIKIGKEGSTDPMDIEKTIAHSSSGDRIKEISRRVTSKCRANDLKVLDILAIDYMSPLGISFIPEYI